MDRKKGNALLIAIGGMKKPPKEMEKAEAEDEGGEEEYSEETAIAQDILDAIESGSAADLAESLKAFIEYCS